MHSRCAKATCNTELWATAMKHDRAIHQRTDPTLFGTCDLCDERNVEIKRYRGEFWCELCINREEWFEHCEEAGRC